MNFLSDALEGFPRPYGFNSVELVVKVERVTNKLVDKVHERTALEIVVLFVSQLQSKHVKPILLQVCLLEVPHDVILVTELRNTGG